MEIGAEPFAAEPVAAATAAAAAAPADVRWRRVLGGGLEAVLRACLFLAQVHSSLSNVQGHVEECFPDDPAPHLHRV